MSLSKLSVLVIFIACFISPSMSVADEHKENQFFEGAMTIYSKFKEPSKEHSEEFYAFIKSKWQQAKCDTSCSVDGKDAAHEYAMKKQVKLEEEHE